ncbi:MAG: hypothetical protein Q4F31_08060 [Eubacteriales bacterium]|nr:hypothetical protein [Eubacteriales bacterium]
MKKLLKILFRLILIVGGIYAVLFAVFFFDLDGKALFHFVEPSLVKHYDKMERRDPLKKSYDMNKPHYDYGK